MALDEIRELCSERRQRWIINSYSQKNSFSRFQPNGEMVHFQAELPKVNERAISHQHNSLLWHENARDL